MLYKDEPTITKNDINPEKLVSMQIRLYADELINISKKKDAVDIYQILMRIKSIFHNLQYKDSIESAGLLEIPFFDVLIDLLGFSDLQITIIVMNILKQSFVLDVIPSVLDYLRSHEFIEKTLELVNKGIPNLIKNVIELYSELVSDGNTYEYISQVFSFTQMDEIINTVDGSFQPVRNALTSYIYKISTLDITNESLFVELAVRAQQLLHNFPNEQCDEKLIWTLINILSKFPDSTVANVDILMTLQELDVRILELSGFSLTGTLKLIADSMRLGCPFRPASYDPYIILMKNHVIEPNAVAICAVILTEFALSEIRNQANNQFYVEGFVTNIIELFFAQIDTKTAIKHIASCGLFQILTLYLPMHENAFEFVINSGLFAFIDRVADIEDKFLWVSMLDMLEALFSKVSDEDKLDELKELFVDNNLSITVDEHIDECDSKELSERLEEFKSKFFSDCITEYM